jgi:hypothetical protein
MRWKTGQSVGEKIVGVRLVVEKKVRLDEEVNGRNGDYHRE